MLATAALVAGVAQGALARAAVGRHALHRGATAGLLQVTYSVRDFTLHYTLRCGPAWGTLAHPAAACAAVARNPIMVRGEPPEPLGTSVRSCPAPRETIHVTGTYGGAPVAAYGGEPCGGWRVLQDWQPFLPSTEYLDGIRLNKGAGPLQLDERRAAVRSLLGAPSETILGADVYISEMSAIDALTPSGSVVGFVREMFVVGYGRHGVVTTIISNWLAVTSEAWRTAGSAPASSALPHARSVTCAGRRSLASRARDAPGSATILWPSAGNSTVIVTRTSMPACRLARATEQPVVNSI